MSNKLVNAALAVGLVGGGLYIANEVFDIPVMKCVTEPSVDHCLGWLGIHGPKRNQDDGKYTSVVTGQISSIEINSLDWPIMDRILVIDPLQIYKGDELAYEEESVSRITTAMRGEIVAITVDTAKGEEKYIMGIDNNNTPDIKTDDTVRPIDVNDFAMVSSVAGNQTTFPENQRADYEACVEQVKANNPDYGGCTIVGTDGHDEAIDATILDNLRGQYIDYDGCVIDTLHITSNLVLEGKTPDTSWTKEFAQTITVGNIAAKAFSERFTPTLNLPSGNVHVVMALDDLGNPVEWKPGDRIDLSAVESLSNGKYKAPGVSNSRFCLGSGSWQNGVDAQHHIDFITAQNLVDPKLLSRTWLDSMGYNPVEIPLELKGLKRQANGVFVPTNG